MMLYKNTKVNVHSPEEYTDYFDYVAGVLQGDTLTPYLFIIYQDYVLRMSVDSMRENSFKPAKERSTPHKLLRTRTTPDDITLRANTLAQAEFLQHSLEHAAGGISLHVNADKTEYMSFNQRGDISTLNNGPLKLMDKFTYFGSSLSSTENDINTRLAKAWTAIDKLSVIWKSDLTYKIIRCFFFKQRTCWYCYMDAPQGR